MYFCTRHEHEALILLDSLLQETKMTQFWLGRLLIGTNLTDEQYEDIPKPRLELHVHVLYKNAEVGLFLGMGILGPLIGAYKGRSWQAVRSTALKGGKIGAGLMLPLAPLMTEKFIYGNEDERIYDRAFRLRHHETQLRADRWATYGGLAGLSSTLITGVPLVNGGMVGFLAGSVSAGIYSNLIMKMFKPKEEIEEQVKE